MTVYAHRTANLGPYVVDPLKHRGLAAHVAAKFHCVNLDERDLRQEAFAALCVACRTYEEGHDTAFSTWATRCIHDHLVGAVLDNARTGQFGRFSQHRFVASRVNRLLHQNPDATAEEVLALMVGSSWGGWGSSKTTLEDARGAMLFVQTHEIRLDRNVEDGSALFSRETPLIETIPDEAHEDDTEHAAVMAAWETLLEAMPMDDREREILDRRLLSEVPDTLQEIGDRWGVTRERIRQIEAGLIARLREAAVAAGLKAA